MPSNLELPLTEELRRYVDSRAGDQDVYATPAEFICDLIRRDMEDWATVQDVVQGLSEVRNAQFVSESILDIASRE